MFHATYIIFSAARVRHDVENCPKSLLLTEKKYASGRV